VCLKKFNFKFKLINILTFSNYVFGLCDLSKHFDIICDIIYIIYIYRERERERERESKLRNRMVWQIRLENYDFFFTVDRLFNLGFQHVVVFRFISRSEF